MGRLHWELWPVAPEPALRLLMGLWEWEGLTPDCSKNAERGLQLGDESCCLKVDPGQNNINIYFKYCRWQRGERKAELYYLL